MEVRTYAGLDLPFSPCGHRAALALRVGKVDRSKLVHRRWTSSEAGGR